MGLQLCSRIVQAVIFSSGLRRAEPGLRQGVAGAGRGRFCVLSPDWLPGSARGLAGVFGVGAERGGREWIGRGWRGYRSKFCGPLARRRGAPLFSSSSGLGPLGAARALGFVLRTVSERLTAWGLSVKWG